MRRWAIRDIAAISPGADRAYGEDLGRLGARVGEMFVRRPGRSRWEAHRDSVEALRDGIRRRIEGMALDLGRVRLYQDGLPVCGREEAIVRELSTQRSRNHRLLGDPIDGGRR